MHTTGFYGCCGANIIYLDTMKFSPESELAVKKYIDSQYNANMAFEMIILAKRNDQYGFKKVLRKLGFRSVSTGANGMHQDQELCLMVRTRKKGQTWKNAGDNGTRTWGRVV